MTTLASIGIHPDTTHIGFADEAYWNERRHRFRSVVCLTAKAQDYDQIEKELCYARCDAGAKIAEIKWVELTDDERKRDAISVLGAVVKLIADRKLSVDILVWHALGAHSSDAAKLREGYSSILQSSVSRSLQEPLGDSMIFYSFRVHAPDDRILADVRGDLLQHFMNTAGVESVAIERAKTALNYMVQVADLFAGMSAYSCAYADDYEAWLKIGHRSLPGGMAPSWKNRFPVIADFLAACENAGLNITLGAELRDELDSLLRQDIEPRIMMHLAK